jgi:hypothetical protein
VVRPEERLVRLVRSPGCAVDAAEFLHLVEVVGVLLTRQRVGVSAALQYIGIRLGAVGSTRFGTKSQRDMADPTANTAPMSIHAASSESSFSLIDE